MLQLIKLHNLKVWRVENRKRKEGKLWLLFYIYNFAFVLPTCILENKKKYIKFKPWIRAKLVDRLYSLFCPFSLLDIFITIW